MSGLAFLGLATYLLVILPLLMKIFKTDNFVTATVAPLMFGGFAWMIYAFFRQMLNAPHW